jgi:hypothetical protein
MGQTSIFKLRWPEKTGVPADGPDGYKDLAQDVEDQMIRMRERVAYTASTFPEKSVSPGATVTLFDVTVDPDIPGWVTIELHGQLYWGVYGNFAGTVTATMTKGGYETASRAFRWQSRGAGLNSTLMGRFAVSTLDMASQRLLVKAFVDTGSVGAVAHRRWSYIVQAYGGKKAGS